MPLSLAGTFDSPHSHEYSHDEDDNFCRNPDGYSGGVIEIESYKSKYMKNTWRMNK